jgi:hypothetical protein
LTRKVEPVQEFEKEVLTDFSSPSVRCVEGADLLLQELEECDPDLNERCGLLANRYEIYAQDIPGCSTLKLIVSLDTHGIQPWPCKVHGLASRAGRPCEIGRSRAVRHLKLINPSWEPADD